VWDRWKEATLPKPSSICRVVSIQYRFADTYLLGDAENARPENDGQRKLCVWKMQDWKMTDKNYGVWKMQDWKMTDKILANSEQNYGVWKMQDWKMTDKILANCEHNYGVWKMQEYKSS